ncbi:transporter, MotA/TolQ/ExbB proton channel family protein [Selenomonas sp. oral taxon 892 str. F0426]|uniref:MotA/TolQ/ExbB proton channel family protein n=1 Tax=Selenomonas sp. oral taxon 892 TaxID=1321785 RepID=UPI0003AD6D15|nr:MotA/TolQ/ExbB proton channel family protein [Selenomonas sp. oral taxon 892]ERJ89306.1 transporter, MotA/TolQ/ExbB proton channel family protein [Selenomonas sp. oral taxon 892 str. F0426]
MDFISQGIDFFQQGGLVMYFLLAASIFVVFIGIERALYFARMDAGSAFAREFMLHIANGRFKEAVDLTDTQRGAIADILFGAVAKNSKNSRKMSSYMEIQSGIALSKLRSRMYYLSVIVTMAPLLGLLGTISGMISTFSVFNLEAGEPSAITGGVGEALIATAMGLCVAIIALSVHAYFSQRIENIVTDMEMCFSAAESSRVELARAAGVKGVIETSLHSGDAAEGDEA